MYVCTYSLTHDLFLSVDEQLITGRHNLMEKHELLGTYARYSGKKVGENLSSFLTSVAGDIDTPARLPDGSDDGSSLRGLLEKHIVAKEIVPLSSYALSGFRLHPGPVRLIYFLSLLGKKTNRT